MTLKGTSMPSYLVAIHSLSKRILMMQNKQPNPDLHLTARGYLIDCLITNTLPSVDQNELREVLLYLNNLITFDEINLKKEEMMLDE